MLILPRTSLLVDELELPVERHPLAFQFPLPLCIQYLDCIV